MQADSIVLGAGIVGVSIAIHLQMRGRATVLVDRRGVGEETSYGNAGLIERSGVTSAPFPQAMAELFRYGLNNRTDMHYHLAALPRIAPFLARYWWASRPESYRRIMLERAPLVLAAIDEHRPLLEQAGAMDLIVKTGSYTVYRDAAMRDSAFRQAERLDREFGLRSRPLDEAAMQQVEPGLASPFAGALHRDESWNIRDPGALMARYGALFQSLGGTVLRGDALALQPGASGAGWRLPVEGGVLKAREAVIALGAWAGDLTDRLGYRLPLGVKRGYHMHYGQPAADPLQHWVLDADYGYYFAPMARGIRLTTGAEFALRDAPSTLVQLSRVEPHARRLFPGLGARLDREPWRGARPVTPDMKPVIGAAPRHEALWFAFGHAHHGMTLGPVTGRLLAEMVTGETPFIDPAPFSPRRFN